MSVEALLAILVALAVSVVLALGLPTWASLGIALAAVVTVVIGGAALLAKVAIAGGLIAIVAFAARTYVRRRARKRFAVDVKWAAIPEVQNNRSEASARRNERRVA